MKYIIDGRQFELKMNGIARYVNDYIESIDGEVFILVRNKINEIHAINNNWNIISENTILRFLPSNIWFKFRAGILINNYKADYFIASNTLIPFFLNKDINITSIVHDFVFEKCPKSMSTVNYIFYKLFFYRDLKKCDVIITTTNTTQLLMGKKIDTAVKVCRPKISKSLLTISKKYQNLTRKSNQLLFVSTIEPRKRITLLISSFIELRKFDNTLELIIIGRFGWGYSKGSNILSALSSTPGIKWIQNANDDLLARYYCTASLLVFPSQYEGFGIPLLEASFFGLPTLATNTPEMIEASGPLGYFWNEDSESLHKCIKKTLFTLQQERNKQ